jgi:hypothetical protein
MQNINDERDTYSMDILNKQIKEIQKATICLFTGNLNNRISAAPFQRRVREFLMIANCFYG